jgi:threonine dehydrogenase-like Zn-dependent dehydrogenase
LRMWRDYFQRAKIVGMDIDPETVKHAEDRVFVEIGDQSSEKDLRRIADLHGPFHVINDDGGHRETDQIFTYKTLLPYVVPGGVYILEDAAGNDAVEFMLRIARGVIQGSVAGPFGSSDDPMGLVESVAFYRETTVTTRRKVQA